MYSFQMFFSRSRRLMWSMGMGMTAAFLLLFVLYSVASAALTASGAGGCGDFDDAVRLAKDQGTILQMTPNKDTNGVVITRSMRLSGGWNPTVNCEQGNQKFTSTQSYIQYGFEYTPETLSELNHSSGSVLPFDLDGDRVVVENVLIDNTGNATNGAGFSGVISNSSEVYIKNTTFEFSVADQNGGALNWHVANDSHVLMEDVVFEGNEATELGGGIYIVLTDNSSLTLDRVTFLNNVGESGGLAIYVDETSRLLIKNSLFDNNRTELTSQSGGGGQIFVNGGEVVIQNSQFVGNDAGENGGGLYVEFDGGEMTLQNVLFDSNTADNQGSALYISSVGNQSAMMNLVGVTLNNNGPASPIHTSTSGTGSFQLNNYGQMIYMPVAMNSAAPNTERAWITDITLDENYNYVVEFEANFDLNIPGTHVHFFFDTISPDQAGTPAPSTNWILYGEESPFTQYTFFDRPFGSHAAEKMCVLVANQNHTVRQGTGNCVRLP